MMNQEEYDIKIADYFEDRMSPAEEEAFMQELGNNNQLRTQYEDELFVRSLLAGDKKEAGEVSELFLQLTNNNANTADLPPAKEAIKKTGTPVIKIFTRYKNIAAVLIALISITVFILWGTKKGAETGNEVIVNIPKDTAAKVNQGNGSKSSPPPSNILAQTIFQKFHTAYSGQNDPVEISNYYADYKKGNYASVLLAKEGDYQVMGTGNRNGLLNSYMHLYKGLCYLNENKPQNAIQQFNFVLQSSGKTEARYYDAQWYKVLALLKKNDTGEALAMAKLVMQSASPYRNKATELTKELNDR